MQVVSGPIGREKIHFEAPPSGNVDLVVRKFISWWEKGSSRMEGLLRAGIAHFRFITIHPFEDGNGRIARALTDIYLAQDEDLTPRFYRLFSRIMLENRLGYRWKKRRRNPHGYSPRHSALPHEKAGHQKTATKSAINCFSCLSQVKINEGIMLTRNSLPNPRDYHISPLF